MILSFLRRNRPETDLRERLDFEGLGRMTYPDQPQLNPKKFGALKQMLDIAKELVRFESLKFLIFATELEGLHFRFPKKRIQECKKFLKLLNKKIEFHLFRSNSWTFYRRTCQTDWRWTIPSCLFSLILKSKNWSEKMKCFIPFFAITVWWKSGAKKLWSEKSKRDFLNYHILFYFAF